MTICNMSIEAGARAGMIAPDDTTFQYIAAGNRPFAPRGSDLDAAIADWKSLKTDDPSAFNKHIAINATKLIPQVTWGTNPAMTVDVTDRVPDPDHVAFASREDARRRWITWASRPARRSRKSRSMWSSSAPAPTAGSRTFARRPGC